MVLVTSDLTSVNFFSAQIDGFTPEFLGRIKLVTSIASLVGVGLYNGFLKNVALRKIFLVMAIIGSALGMTQVGTVFFSFFVFFCFLMLF